MNIYSLIPFIAGIAYIPILIIVMASRPFTRQHQLFMWYLVAAMVWSLSSFALHSYYMQESKLVLAKLMTCAFIWMAVQLYYFSRSFGYGKFSYGLLLGYSLLTFVTVVALLGYIPGSVVVNQGVRISYGLWMPLLFIPLCFLMVDNVLSQTRKLKVTTDAVERTRVIYILLGVGITAAFSMTNVVEYLRRFPVDHLGNLAVACLWTYAALQHQIVDVRFAARRGIAWVGLLAVGLVTYLALYLVFGLILNLESQTAIILSATVGALIIGLIIYRLRDFSIKLVDRLFYKKSFDYRQELSEFVGHKLSGVFSLEDLSTGFLPLIVGSVGSRKAYLLLPDVITDDFVIQFVEPEEKKKHDIRIRQANPLCLWLNRENRALTSEKMDFIPELRGIGWELREQMVNLGIELLFPMISRGNLIAILMLSQKNTGHYSLEDINLVESATRQVAVSLEKEYLQEQLKRREVELSVINRLINVISSNLNIEAVYEVFVEELMEVIDLDWAIIATIEGADIHFEAVYSTVDLPWNTGGNIPFRGTATEWLATNKKALYKSSLDGKSQFWTEEEYSKAGLKSMLYLPLLVKGEAIGSLVIGSCHPDAYSPEQVNLLESLASQIAVSVDNSRLYAKAEQRARVDELTGLFNRRHFDESLGREIDRHARHGGFLSLAILDLDGFKQYNDKNGHLAGDKVLSRVGQVIEKAVRSVDMAFRYGGDEFAVLLPSSDSSSAFTVAERIRTRLARDLEEEKVKLTASIGLACWPSDGVILDDIITAADRALYYAKRTGGNRTSVVSKMVPQEIDAKESGTEREKEAISTIYALASTIEARDQYTYGHSRDVRRYSVMLAEELGLPSDKVTVIGTAALLHDIGKIGIPDEVLNKPGRLDAAEWELIRSHPKLAATIVGHVPSLTPCLPAILHHHERWDGLGYPSGLRGESIPLEARILSVADAFEAMTSPRPYRDRMSVEDALEELRRCANNEFDPHLVDVFISIISAEGEITARKQVATKKPNRRR